MASQPPQGLPIRKLNHVPIRITHRGEITDHATDLSWRFDQDVPGAGEFGDSINLCARVTLKSEMIQQRFHLVLHNHQHENRIFAGRRLWSEPDIVPPFQATIANDTEAAD